MTGRSAELRTASLHFIEGGLLHLRWHRDIDIGHEDARAAMEMINATCTGRPHPLLIDMAGSRHCRYPDRRLRTGRRSAEEQDQDRDARSVLHNRDPGLLEVVSMLS